MQEINQIRESNPSRIGHRARDHGPHSGFRPFEKFAIVFPSSYQQLEVPRCASYAAASGEVNTVFPR